MKARIFNCRRCQIQVVICSYCDHGQIYCSRGCSQEARASSCRLASRRYQNSRQGKLKHAARQSNYMERKRAGIKMTYQGSQEAKDVVLLTPDKMEIDKFHCHFCRMPVDKFLDSLGRE